MSLIRLLVSICLYFHFLTTHGEVHRQGHIQWTDCKLLLSTPRTFTNITSGRNMEHDRQDAVLRILHLMIRFPLAVRTAYVLMRGDTPQPLKCAALS
jgi:hypothetical protein